MAMQNNKTKINPKAAINNKKRISRVRKKKGLNVENNKKNSKLLFFVVLFSGILLIISSYAWLSQSLNVKVKFFDLKVSTDNGLFISLDGINYSDSVVISADTVITDLKTRYPSHTNQWATNGLWPVSTNGIINSNSDKFNVYAGEVKRRKGRTDRRKYLNTLLITEDAPASFNYYIAFDIFLKNVSGSPNSDNLFLALEEDAFAYVEEDTPEDVKEAMEGLINSIRFGLVRIGSISSKASARDIQNLKCNNNCSMLIYEPNSVAHSSVSIENAKEYSVTLVDGVYNPTYAVIKDGGFLEHANGQEGSGIPLDNEHFSLQNTIKEQDFNKPIFQVPNAVTKLRAYVWLEGQDMDSLETTSKGADIYLSINLVKDLAGYE